MTFDWMWVAGYASLLPPSSEHPRAQFIMLSNCSSYAPKSRQCATPKSRAADTPRNKMNVKAKKSQRKSLKIIAQTTQAATWRGKCNVYPKTTHSNICNSLSIRAIKGGCLC